MTGTKLEPITIFGLANVAGFAREVLPDGEEPTERGHGNSVRENRAVRAPSSNRRASATKKPGHHPPDEGGDVRGQERASIRLDQPALAVCCCADLNCSTTALHVLCMTLKT
jgi:hypothetical protein